MSLVVIGLNQRLAQLDLLERMNIAADALPKALHDVCSREHVAEAVVLSTCNRTEVYVEAEKFHGAYDDVRSFLSETSGMLPEEFSHHLYTYYDADAVRHLFTVASGADSVVLGETEVLGQVRGAWETALAERSVGSTLKPLFRQAIEVGKRARTETGISRHITSVSQAAVAMAAERLQSLAGRSVLLLGAGEMGRGMAIALHAAGVDRILVANRTFERAAELADLLDGEAVPLDQLPTALGQVDVLLTSTGASSLIVEQGTIGDLMAKRPDHPLLIVDIAVPRDIDPGAGSIPNVTLLDMDDLKAFADAGLAERRRELASVHSIIDQEVIRYLDLSTTREVEPVVAALFERSRLVRDAEFERFNSRLSALDDDQREAVEALVHGLLGKMLHDPVQRLKRAAGTARGDRLAEALTELFDL
ncbi:MAG: glutamyl-tRNA reductase [Acidimicrobiales bacterium]|nr:glutamyl-tRNA reductase [Acidimicrobiales bacterium]